METTIEQQKSPRIHDNRIHIVEDAQHTRRDGKLFVIVVVSDKAEIATSPSAIDKAAEYAREHMHCARPAYRDKRALGWRDQGGTRVTGADMDTVERGYWVEIRFAEAR